jgi:hypothetical protein
MNAAATLIAEFHQRGIRLIPDPPKLAVEPSSKLTDADRASIRQYKADLLALLAADRDRAEIDRIARLDAERREADRQAGRGYDFDSTSPSRAECVSRTDPLSDPPHPAYSIIATCRRHGVDLRIDGNGALKLGKAETQAAEPAQAWPSLIRAIEAHFDSVARLVAAGWHLRADFSGPMQ